jgi:hypothetical protein
MHDGIASEASLVRQEVCYERKPFKKKSSKRLRCKHLCSSVVKLDTHVLERQTGRDC